MSNHKVDSKYLLKELLSKVKECQNRYGGKTELATEKDQRIVNLCDTWDTCLSHGLKSNTSVIKNVTDIVSKNVIEAPSFWEIAYKHLTAHEKERFTTLRHVWTDRGKMMALIRSALNERSLERYILIWLNEPYLQGHFETWALMLDNEATNLLPSIAAGLGSILFAITIDSTDVNVSSRPTEIRVEPVIIVPPPAPTSRPIGSRSANKRQIISFDEEEPSTSSASSISGGGGSVPKSLSHMCLKINETASIKPTTINVHDNHDESYSSRSHTLMNSSLAHDDTAAEEVFRQEEPPANIIKIFEECNERFKKIPATETLEESDCNSNEITDSDDVSSGGGDKNGSINDLVNESKMNSETVSMSSEQDSGEVVANLKMRLQESIDRCNMLGTRVAELSLENHRLRGLNNSSRHGGNAFNYFSVSIPRVLLQRTPHSRNYYTYEIHIIPTQGGDEWTVLRRYSEFYKLHKKYQKDNVAIKTLDFPPKKKFGNMEAYFVEQRRQRLQVYLRHLLAILPEVNACTTRTQLEQVFSFFN